MDFWNGRNFYGKDYSFKNNDTYGADDNDYQERQEEQYGAPSDYYPQSSNAYGFGNYGAFSRRNEQAKPKDERRQSENVRGKNNSGGNQSGGRSFSGGADSRGGSGAKTSAYQDNGAHRVDGNSDFSRYRENLDSKAQEMGMNKDDFQNKFNRYQNKSEDSLMSEMLSTAAKMKADGSFSAEELESFYERVSGYMSAEQQQKLRSLIDMLK